MSRDGYLPDDVNEEDLPGASDEHYDSCPEHEDAMQIWAECGGIGQCVCFPDTVMGRFKRWWTGYGDDFCLPQEPECLCSEIAADEEASRAEAYNDLMSDR